MPLAYGVANKVPTALGVATDKAVARLPLAQPDTSAVAAVLALGCSAEGSATVVVVLDAADVDVVETALVACGVPVL
jgi:hypothetical protein